MQPGLLRFAVILALLSMIGPFAIDMYLPAMPEIARDLASSEAAIQATITSYFAAFGIAQLVYGPWADASGRKPPIYFGVAVFLVGSAGAALTGTLEGLIAWRFLQGLGGAAVMVVPRAIIRDRHTGAEATRLMALIMLVISISPMLAPLAGSAVIAVAGWRAIFGVLCVTALASLTLTATALPETLAVEHRTPVNLRALRRGAAILLSDAKFIGLTFVGALGMGSFFIFIASAPFVYTGQFGLTPTQFSLAFAINAIGFFGASQAAGPLAERFGLSRVVLAGTAIFAVATLCLAALTFSIDITLPLLVGGLFIGNAGLGLVIRWTITERSPGWPRRWAARCRC
jgi:DHA1 family bicyclomycin/chloramphenicol resistance-like MFS transporter